MNSNKNINNNCPNCGAPRSRFSNKCEYCGSFLPELIYLVEEIDYPLHGDILTTQTTISDSKRLLFGKGIEECVREILVQQFADYIKDKISIYEVFSISDVMKNTTTYQSKIKIEF